MSMEAITAARKLTLPPRDKFVLLALADYANDDGEAYPKQGTLAEWTCYNRTTVNEALANLERAGLIETQQTYRDDGGKSYKRYRLTFLTPHVGETDKGMSARPTRVCRPEQQPLVGEADSKNPQQGTPNKEPKKRDTRKRKGHEFDPETVPLPEQFDREHFVAFCDVRLKKNSPMTAYALRLFLKKHGGLPKDELDARFEKAIVAGWLDLYPVDGNRRPQRAATKGGALDQYTERGL